jgi:hypothetical protein
MLAISRWIALGAFMMAGALVLNHFMERRARKAAESAAFDRACYYGADGPAAHYVVRIPRASGNPEMAWLSVAVLAATLASAIYFEVERAFRTGAA